MEVGAVLYHAVAVWALYDEIEDVYGKYNNKEYIVLTDMALVSCRWLRPSKI